jgi:hypothetical protein
VRALACVLFVLAAAATPGCASGPRVDPPAASPLTQLDVDQVNALLPFMVNRRSTAPQHRAMKLPGQRLVLRETKQAFTFDVWLDGDGRPVPPASAGDPVAALKRPTLHHGSFVLICTSACQWATSDETCEQHGCQPVAEDTCGCTPPDCPGCIPVSCESIVNGAVAGRLIM